MKYTDTFSDIEIDYMGKVTEKAVRWNTEIFKYTCCIHF